MKHLTVREAVKEFEDAGSFERVLENGNRVIIYSLHTDKRGLNVKHWICQQFPYNDRWTVTDQHYLMKNGNWEIAYKGKLIRYFSSVNAAKKEAMKIN